MIFLWKIINFPIKMIKRKLKELKKINKIKKRLEMGLMLFSNWEGVLRKFWAQIKLSPFDFACFSVCIDLRHIVGLQRSSLGSGWRGVWWPYVHGVRWTSWYAAWWITYWKILWTKVGTWGSNPGPHALFQCTLAICAANVICLYNKNKR